MGEDSWWTFPVTSLVIVVSAVLVLLRVRYNLLHTRGWKPYSRDSSARVINNCRSLFIIVIICNVFLATIVWWNNVVFCVFFPQNSNTITSTSRKQVELIVASAVVFSSTLWRATTTMVVVGRSCRTSSCSGYISRCLRTGHSRTERAPAAASSTYCTRPEYEPLSLPPTSSSSPSECSAMDSSWLSPPVAYLGLLRQPRTLCRFTVTS